jgi:hypothetical protein
MAKKEKSLSISFTKEKETKGTFRYAEDGDDPAIGKLYLKKDAAEKLGNPEDLTVTVTPAE